LENSGVLEFSSEFERLCLSFVSEPKLRPFSDVNGFGFRSPGDEPASAGFSSVCSREGSFAFPARRFKTKSVVCW
jgi:hypothetical protein